MYKSEKLETPRGIRGEGERELEGKPRRGERGAAAPHLPEGVSPSKTAASNCNINST